MGSDVEKGKTTLIWAVRNLVGRKFCLLHVHQPKNQPTVASKKATEVCENAPPFSHIWFVSDGQLVFTKIGRDVQFGEQIASTILFPPPDAESGLAFRTKQGTLANEQKSTSQVTDLACSVLDRSKSDMFTLNYTRELVAPQQIGRFSSSHLCEEANFDESEENLRNINSQGAECPSSTSTSSYVTKQAERIHEKGVNAIYLELEPIIANAKCSKPKEFEVSVSQCEEEEEEDVIKYEEKAKSLEISHDEEVDRRKEMERILLIRQETIRRRSQYQEIIEKLQLVREQKSTMEKQHSQSSNVVKDLEGKIISVVELLISFKEKHDRLRVEHEEALIELRKPKEISKM